MEIIGYTIQCYTIMDCTDKDLLDIRVVLYSTFEGAIAACKAACEKHVKDDDYYSVREEAMLPSDYDFVARPWRHTCCTVVDGDRCEVFVAEIKPVYRGA